MAILSKLKKLGDNAKRKSPPWLRAVGRWSLRLAVGLAILIVLLMIALQLPFFKNWVASIVEERLDEAYGVDFTIGELSGTMLGGATLTGFSIANPPGAIEENFISIDEVTVSFNLFELVFGHPELEVAELTGVEVVIESYGDGTSNASRLFTKRDPERSAGKLFDIDDVRLIGGEVRIYNPAGESFSIEEIHAGLRLRLDEGDVDIDELVLHGALPTLELPVFWIDGGVYVERGGSVHLEELSTATLGSLINIDGTVYGKQGELDLELMAANLSLDEVRRALNPELPLAGGVELSAKLWGPYENLRSEMTLALNNPNLAGYLLDELVMDGGYADERLRLDNFRLRRGEGRAGGRVEVDFSGERPVFDGRLTFYGIDPAALAPLELSALPGDLNGRVRLESREGGGYYAEAELFPGDLAGAPIRGVKLAGYGTPRDFQLSEGLLRVAGGRFELSGGIDEGRLDLRLNGEGLRLKGLAGLLGPQTPSGVLGLDAWLQGTLERPRLRCELALSEAEYAGARLDKLLADVRLELPWDAGTGLKLSLEGRGVTYDEYALERLSFDGELSLDPRTTARGELHAQGLLLSGTELASLSLRGGYDDGTARVESLELEFDPATSLRYRGELELRPDGLTVRGEQLEFIHRELHVENAAPFTADYHNGLLRLDPLRLTSEAGDVKLDGEYDTGRLRIKLRLTADGLDLAELERRTALIGRDIAGRGRLSLDLSGELASPSLALESTFSDLSLDDYIVADIEITAELNGKQNLYELADALGGVRPLPPGGDDQTGRIVLNAGGLSSSGYDAERFELFGVLTHEELRLEHLSLVLDGANIDAAGRLSLTDPDRRVELALGAYEFPLDSLPLLPEDLRFENGTLTAQAVIEGPLADPLIHGDLELSADALHLEEYNVTLESLALILDADTRRVVVEEFSTKLGAGEITGVGRLEFGGGVLDGRLELTGRELELRNAADLFTGNCDLDVVGVIDGAGTRIEGVVRVNEGDLELPLGSGGSLKAGKRLPDEGGESPFELDLRLVAERNLWVRSELAELEVAADLQLTLAGNELVLGGELETLRGSVWFLDKAFDLERGGISFGRKAPPDPNLNLEASSVLRSRRRDGSSNETTVNVLIGGTLSAPTVTLTSEPELPEGDIIMLIALDMTWEEYQQMLGEQGAGGAAGHVGGQAALMLAGFIQNKLRRLAREATGLDTLKLEGALDTGGDIERVDLTVGKYISRDLYVSYSRDVLSRGNQSLWVEYFISDNLSAVGSTIEEEGEMSYQLNLKWKIKY